MPTQTKPAPVSETIETATEKVTALGEKAVENGRKTTSALLDSYEETAVALADSYVDAARATNLEWISTIADAQAHFAREVATSYVSAVRILVD
jgi:hypothetical protein